MIIFKRFRIFAGALACMGLLFQGSAQAQKYKTLSDTAKLNKEYGEISLDISKLNTKLITEQNKTADFQSKSISTAQDAVTSGQTSRDQASVATDGNTTDTKRAVHDAKKADQKANNAKDAVSDEKNNSKKITELNSKIAKKRQELAELDTQRAAIMALINPVADIRKDSVLQN
jgi:hypothetical protein